jgi:molybdenum cofactor guanylyltransferase
MKKDMTGIILAGGKNSRMQNEPKAFLKINGVRLIDNILSVYQKIFSEIIIVTNSPLSYMEFPDTVVVTDIYKGKGSLGGIYTGLFYAGYDHSFVAACDMPFLNEEFILYMINQKDKYDIIVPEPSAGVQPLHAIYSRNCLSHIKKMLIADKLKITGFYKEVRTLGIPEEKIKIFDQDGHFFLNINTPEDLQSHQ